MIPSPSHPPNPPHSSVPKNKVFVGGFPVHLDESHLKQYMSGFGEVLACKILRKNGHSRGFGFVTFSSAQSAQDVIKQSHVLEGKTVRFAPFHIPPIVDF